MASANLSGRLESKMEAQGAAQNATNGALKAMVAAQNSNLDDQRWLTGGGFALLGVLVAAYRLLG